MNPLQNPPLVIVKKGYDESGRLVIEWVIQSFVFYLGYLKPVYSSLGN